jgi:hypothetical protein
MDTSKLSFKLFIENPASIKDLPQVVPVFHSWIQMHAIADHLLVDVADYAHVHNGPGVVLVSYEANYSLDKRGGRLGFTYQRKQPLAGDLRERIRAALRFTIEPARLLEQAPAFEGRVSFRTDEIEFRICDRLYAPNTTETFAAVKDDLLSLFPGASLDYKPAAQDLFTVTIRPAKVESLTKIADRLSTMAAG